MNNLPSIFNDVIGPIMRGPSSSHTAGSWRVAKIAVQLLNKPLSEALISFDKDGAWVTNYEDQGTVLGMNGGLLEIDMADNRMKQTETIAKERGIKINYQISSFKNNHPNSMQLKLMGASGNKVEILAASLGGGSFEIQKIDGFKINTKGDYYELYIWAYDDIEQELQDILPLSSQLITREKSGKFLYVFKSHESFNEGLIRHIKSFPQVGKVADILPIMPIVSGRQKALPFDSVEHLSV